MHGRMSAAVLACALLAPAGALAWGFYDSMEYGTTLVSITPTTAAMGGARALPGAGGASVFLNPAELAGMEGVELQAASGWIQWSSDVRGLNEFEHGETGTMLGPACATLRFGLPGDLAGSVGFASVADFRFDGTNMVLSEPWPGRYEIVAVDNLDSRGSLWEICAGFGGFLTDRVAVGLSGGLRSGSGDWELFHNVLEGGVDYTVTGSWEEAAGCVHVGALVDAGIATVGLSAVTGSDMYRDMVSVGVQRRMEPLNGPVGCEMTVQDVSGDSRITGTAFVAVNGLVPNVRNVYSVGFDRVPEYSRAGLCMGTGATLDLRALTLEMAVEWRTTGRAGHSVPDSLVTSVDQSETYYLAGLTWDIR